MKTTRLTVSIIAIICIFAFGVATTVAYLSSITKPVENTFTVGSVKLTLTETTGSEYQMLPGTAVRKDPTVTVKGGSEECYVFVKLERTGDLDSYVTYELADGWTHLGGYDGVYYRTVTASAVDKKYAVLKDDQILIRDTLTKEKIKQIESGALPEIRITAYAIQTYGLLSVAEGWHDIMGEYGG